MARLRLFAQLRELAGTATTEIDADSVGSLLASAAATYGEGFARSMKRARVWVNGEPATEETPLHVDDEVALIPPVSGGAETIAARGTDLRTMAPVLAAVVLIVANLPDSPTWFVSALVGAGAIWAVDLVDAARSSAVSMQLPPVLATVLVGAIAPFGMADNTAGVVGLGLVVVFSLMAAFAWSVAVPESRDLRSVATTALAQVIVGTGIGSLVLARLSPDGRARVGLFLVVVVVSAGAWWLAGRGRRLAVLDPFAAGAIAAVLGALGAAWLWDLGILPFLFVGVVLALALIAGRGFGAMVRTGEVYLVDQPPGMLTPLDGPILAAAAFYPILQLVV